MNATDHDSTRWETDPPTDAHSIRVLYAGRSPSSGIDPTAVANAAEDLTVEHVTDFVTARKRVSGDGVDCVLATHQDGGFDGLAFLEAVHREYPDFPVVLVPETVTDSVATRAVAADATALVSASEDTAIESVVDAIRDAAATGDDTRSPRMPVSDLPIQAERRLKERALDDAPVGITISDATRPGNPIIYLNDSFQEMTGYAPEDVIGVNHRFLQGPETDPDRVTELDRGIGEGRETRVVLRNYTADGVRFWNQVDISPVVQDGEVTHYVGFQMDITERKRAQQRLAEEREALDRLLDRLNGLFTDVTAALVRADSREAVEELTIERLAEGEEYAAAWLGRYDATADEVTVDLLTTADDDVIAPEADAQRLGLDDYSGGVRALADAIERQEPLIVDDVTGIPRADAGRRCVLVPLTYRSTTYGVLAVFDDEDFLDERERHLLGVLGRNIGSSINDLLTKQTLTSDNALIIETEIHGDLPLVDLAAELDCEFDHGATITDEGDLLLVGSIDREDPETVIDAAGDTEGITAAECLVADQAGCVVQLRLSASPLQSLLTATAGRVTAMHTEGAVLQLTLQVGTEQAAQRLLDELREYYERVELVAYHQSEKQITTARGFREELRNRLTDRQLTALQKAYVSGFFEWPSRADGAQLAESMDIVPSTYHQHLKAAQRKLMEAFFEG